MGKSKMAAGIAFPELSWPGGRRHSRRPPRGWWLAAFGRLSRTCHLKRSTESFWDRRPTDARMERLSISASATRLSRLPVSL